MFCSMTLEKVHRKPCPVYVEDQSGCHDTETIAKLARLRPAKNDTTLTKLGRVDNVLLDDLVKSAQKTLFSVC